PLSDTTHNRPSSQTHLRRGHPGGFFFLTAPRGFLPRRGISPPERSDGGRYRRPKAGGRGCGTGEFGRRPGGGASEEDFSPVERQWNGGVRPKAGRGRERSEQGRCLSLS